VLGIAAYGRTQEKLGGANNGGIQLPANAGTTYIPPSAGGMNNTGFNTPQSSPAAFGAPSTGGFGSPATSFNPAPSWGTTPVSTGFGGKKVVPDFPQPAI
jgi:hypothetical protein